MQLSMTPSLFQEKQTNPCYISWIYNGHSEEQWVALWYLRTSLAAQHYTSIPFSVP